MQGSLTADQFEELALMSVGTNEHLQEQLVDAILDYHDVAECVRWAVHFQLPQEKLPYQVWDAIAKDLVHLQKE